MIGPDQGRGTREEARELRSSGDHARALPLFEELWQDDGEPWDGWGAAFCLRKLGRPKEAAVRCREVEKRHPGFQPIHGLHGWCLYDEYLRSPEQFTPDVRLRVLAAVATAAVRSGEPYSDFSPLVRSVFSVAKSFRDPYRPKEILSALDHLDPALMSGSFDTVTVKGREQKILSERERYYHARTKALFALERWEECAESCITALESVPRFRADGMAWIERRLGLAVLEAGDAEHAAALMADVLTRRNEWYIHDDLAQALVALDRPQEARQELVTALAMKGPREMKVGALKRLALLEEGLQHPESARAHATVAVRLRTENGWSEDKELSDLLERLGRVAGDEQDLGWGDLKRFW